MTRHLPVGGDSLGATPCGSTGAPARYPSLAVAAVLAAGFVTLVTVLGLVVSAGVLTAHAAAAKPSIQSCTGMQPHVGPGR